MSRKDLNIRVARGYNDSLLGDDFRFIHGQGTDRARHARMQRNAAALERMDAVGSGEGILFARDLEHIYDEVIQEDYKPLNAERLIPTDTSVNEAMQKHTVQSISHAAEVTDYRGFGDNPASGTAAAKMDRESFSVGTYVTGIRISFTDRLAEQFANTNLRSELSLAANQAMREFLNERTWYGSDEYDILGVLNYPYVPKTVSSVDMTSSGTPADQLAELHRLANELGEYSDNTYMPDTLVAPIPLVNYWSNTKVNLDGDTDTILELFLRHNQYVGSVEGIREMAGAGPNGEDVLYFYRANDRMSCVNVIPKAPTMLPVQQDGPFDLLIPMYMRHGGIIMRKPANNLVVYL